MRDTPPRVLTCTCEGTMSLDAGALDSVGAGGKPASQLCRAQLEHFHVALAEAGLEGSDLIVTCMQEEPLLREIAEEEDFGGRLDVVNIRETAGWSDQAGRAGPKMAALIAMAAVQGTSPRVITLESDGVALILGRDGVALEVAAALAETLEVTVLLPPGADVQPPRETRFPVLQGQARKAAGVLGAFTITVDALATPLPSSRRQLTFGPGQSRVESRCDLIIDLTGDAALFPAPELRPGYLRADPRDPVAVARLIAGAAGRRGSFDKPVHIDFRDALCAHSRNRLTGCTRCLSLCPTGAITPAGDSVAIDPAVCAGCGACAAACPTGAAGYALPSADTLAARLCAGLGAWYAAGGKGAPVILFHDGAHGAGLIDAAARFGRGLPAQVIPLQVNEISQIGPETLAAALAYGAGALRLLTRVRPLHDLSGLDETLALIELLAAAAGRPEDALALIQTDDPEALEGALYALPERQAPAARSSFLPPEDKRDLLVRAVAEMNRTAPASALAPADALPLPEGAPFGAVVVDAEACTLCMACTGACPTGALLEDTQGPRLRFTETACVQCGLCAASCPESALTLEPRVDFAAWEAPGRVLDAAPRATEPRRP